jgi:rhodanese-related sulfurtransferase
VKKKPITIIIILVVTALVSVLILILKDYYGADSGFDIDSAEFEKLMKEPDAVILDVRTAGEFSKERIQGAVLLDINSPAFKDRIKRFHKDKIYLVYCRSGNRSARACKIMSEFGFERCYNLKYGIIGWKNRNKPVVN